MIRVLIYLNDESTQLCEMKIENTGEVSGDLTRYHAELATDRVETVQFLSRDIWHDREHQNVLALLVRVLRDLPHEAFHLDGPIPTGPYRRKRNLFKLLPGGKG